MIKIVVRAPVLSQSGYGEQARFALRALRRHEDKFDIHLININWGRTGWISQDDEERQWIDYLLQKTMHYVNHANEQQQPPKFDMSLQVTIPNEWEKMAPYNIGYTAGIETTKVAPQWIEKAKLMDRIIVVSNHSKNVYDSTTYVAENQAGDKIAFRNETPIDVVNYPVKSFETSDLGLNLETEFNFLSVAQWGPRKNMENLVRWWVEEFENDEVGLVLKGHGANCSTMDRQATFGRIKNLLSTLPSERKCKVYLLHGSMSDQEMHSLYVDESIKALASLTHGEGFGLPLFEAAYSALPVICPAWSGQMDFLFCPVKRGKQKKAKNRPHFAKVDYSLAPVQQFAVWEGVVQPDSMWCYADEKSFKKTIRDVYTNYNKYKNDAKRLQKHLLTTFESDKIHDSFVSSVLKPLGLSLNVDDEQDELQVFG